MSVSREEFVAVFLENVRVRSRTSHGQYDSSVSELKPMELAPASGAVAATVTANSKRLAEAIWTQAPRCECVGPDGIRRCVEGWERIVNAGLHAADAPVYRTWTLAYSWWTVDEIELALAWFCARLSHMISGARDGFVSSAEVIAFADYMIDGEIHPFADGCGRVATALMMWLSLVLGGEQLPHLRERDEHYAAIRQRDFCAHVLYVGTLLADA